MYNHSLLASVDIVLSATLETNRKTAIVWGDDLSARQRQG